ncbi:hypothetical protein D3C86_1882760 [compost metagenome]
MFDFREKPGTVQSRVALSGQPHPLDAACLFQLTHTQMPVAGSNDSWPKMRQQKTVELSIIEDDVAGLQLMEIQQYKLVGAFLEKTNHLHDQVFQ